MQYPHSKVVSANRCRYCGRPTRVYECTCEVSWRRGGVAALAASAAARLGQGLVLGDGGRRGAASRTAGVAQRFVETLR